MAFNWTCPQISFQSFVNTGESFSGGWGGGGGVFIFRGKFERGGGQEEVNYKFNLF